MTTSEQPDWASHYAARAAEAEEEAREDYLHPRKAPLRTNQHILHLLLTVFTCGAWGIVWAIRAWQGNRR